jgi:type IV pilus assembly protein PilM
MSVLSRLTSVLRDPPPEFVFEIAADGIAMSRTRPPATMQYQPLAPGVLVPSPVRDNVTDADALADAVRKLVPPGSGRRKAALILPDNALRITVLDFESLPAKEEERQSLIKFRIRKTLPFDVDEAAFSYHVQAGNKVIVAVTPVEVIARYEAPFRAVGLHPGFITSSSLALLELLPTKGSILAAHRSSGALTVLALRDGILTLARSLELTENIADPVAEVSDDLYPTLIYLEDQTGHRPDKLILVGQVSDLPSPAAERLGTELNIPTEALHEDHPGLAGYLRSLSVASAVRKAAGAAQARTAA